MNTSYTKIIAGLGMAVCCLAAAQAQTTPASGKEVNPPTGTTGATAFQPQGSARGEVEAGSAQNGNAGVQQKATPGFDNKPAKGAKADCHRPQGGNEASGGENVGTASKDNKACTGKKDKKAERK